MSHLFTSYDLGPLSLPNRIVVAPMCQYSAVDGCATDWHHMHLGQLAMSGAGLLILEATAVEAQGRITAGDLGLYDDATEAALAAVLQSLRRHTRTPLAIQLAHAGRKASSHAPWDGGGQVRPDQPGGWVADAPSALPHGTAEAAPRALDAAGLARIRDAFADAGRRAVRLGLQAIELHAAHGYLLHQFLSPLSNRREDAYGGSLEGRMRFPLEVFDALRAALPAGFPLGVRVSATDWVDGGWDLAQTTAFAHALRARGCSFIDVSSGGVSPQQKIAPAPGYQVGFADAIRRATGLPTIAVGLITEPEQAEAIVASGQADLVALARGMLYDPRWPWHAAARLGGQVQAPHQFWRSLPPGSGRVFGDTRIGMR